MTQFICAFIDVDGTMVDTEPRNQMAIEIVAARYGYKGDFDWAELQGNKEPAIHGMLSKIDADLANNISPEDFEKECIIQRHAPGMPLPQVREGIREALDMLRQHGIYVAAVSNSYKDEVSEYLSQHQLDKLVEFQLTATEITSQNKKLKPSPEPYYEALKRAEQALGRSIDPAQCIVLEDSLTGVKSGMAAGMEVIHWQHFSPMVKTPAQQAANDANGLLLVIHHLLNKKLPDGYTKFPRFQA